MSASEKSNLDAALFIVHRLREAGHVALFAGGCVRDRLLGSDPQDYDVATDATPEKVRELFPGARMVGARFGVALVRKFRHDVEVVTFRSDGAYSDGRHPDRVVYGDQRADAARRDFTINGLFYDPLADRVIDYVGGQEDLQAGIVRTIGNPDHRFAEDHLRMLRAVRFAARLQFRIHADTLEAIRRHADLLRTISAERIWMELEAILTAPSRARGWALLLDSRLRAHLSTAWPADDEIDRRTGRRLGALPTREVTPSLAASAVLCDLPIERIASVARSFRWSRELENQTRWLISSAEAIAANPEMEPADLKLIMAGGDVSEVKELLRSQAVLCASAGMAVERFAERTSFIAASDVAPPPFVTGHDLAALGVPAGRRMGEILNRLYRAQLNNQLTDKRQAMELARSLLDNK